MPKLGITPGQLESSNVRDAVAVGGEKHSSLGAVSLFVSFNGPTITHRFHVFKSFHQLSFLALTFFKPTKAYLMQKITLPARHRGYNYAIATNTGIAKVKKSMKIHPNSVSSIPLYLANVNDSMWQSPIVMVKKKNMSEGKFDPMICLQMKIILIK